MDEPHNLSDSANKSLTEPNRLLWGTDNPLSLSKRIEILCLLNDKRWEFARKYNLRVLSYDLLLRISSNWFREGRGMNVYGLTGGNCSLNTVTTNAVNTLREKGLIEIAGYGHRGSRLYVPSQASIGELGIISATLQ